MNKETEQDLRDVLARDPTDERTYVILGTMLLRQRRVEEAREVYEEGCTVAQGANAFIWTAIGNLEKKVCTCTVSVPKCPCGRNNMSSMYTSAKLISLLHRTVIFCCGLYFSGMSCRQWSNTAHHW